MTGYLHLGYTNESSQVPVRCVDPVAGMTKSERRGWMLVVIFVSSEKGWATIFDDVAVSGSKIDNRVQQPRVISLEDICFGDPRFTSRMMKR